MSDRLQEIRARLDAATPGPWIIHEDEETGQLDPWDDDGMHPILDSQSNADLIAHAPADIAWLLAEVERMRTENGTELLPDDSVAQGVTELERGV